MLKRYSLSLHYLRVPRAHKFHPAVYLNAIGIVIYHPLGISGIFIIRSPLSFLLYFFLSKVFLKKVVFNFFLFATALKVTKINYISIFALHIFSASVCAFVALCQQ